MPVIVIAPTSTPSTTPTETSPDTATPTVEPTLIVIDTDTPVPLPTDTPLPEPPPPPTIEVAPTDTLEPAPTDTVEEPNFHAYRSLQSTPTLLPTPVPTDTPVGPPVPTQRPTPMPEIFTPTPEAPTITPLPGILHAPTGHRANNADPRNIRRAECERIDTAVSACGPSPRVVLPVLAVLFVFWTGYVAATRHRYEAANGVPGEILAGESLGQTFIARYDGLSGVEVHIATLGLEANPTRSTLVMHLRDGPASSTDLATATIPPSQALDPDPWYTFSFSPIADSRDRSYFLLVESPDGAPGKGLTLLWFQPAPRGDPYADGAAYKNGQPTRGDLGFWPSLLCAAFAGVDRHAG